MEPRSHSLLQKGCIIQANQVYSVPSTVVDGGACSGQPVHPFPIPRCCNRNSQHMQTGLSLSFTCLNRLMHSCMYMHVQVRMFMYTTVHTHTHILVKGWNVEPAVPPYSHAEHKACGRVMRYLYNGRLGGFQIQYKIPVHNYQ